MTEDPNGFLHYLEVIADVGVAISVSAGFLFFVLVIQPRRDKEARQERAERDETIRKERAAIDIANREERAKAFSAYRDEMKIERESHSQEQLASTGDIKRMLLNNGEG